MLEQNPARGARVPDGALSTLSGLADGHLASGRDAAVELIRPVRRMEEDVRPARYAHHLPDIRKPLARVPAEGVFTIRNAGLEGLVLEPGALDGVELLPAEQNAPDRAVGAMEEALEDHFSNHPAMYAPAALTVPVRAVIRPTLAVDSVWSSRRFSTC